MTAAEADALARGERLRLLTIARRHARGEDDAQDALASALLILWRDHQRLEAATADSWLAVVAKHEAIHLARRRAGAVELDAVAEPEASIADPLARLIDRAALTRLRRLKRAELRALLHRAAGRSYWEIMAAEGWSHTKTNRCVTEGRRAARLPLAEAVRR